MTPKVNEIIPVNVHDKPISCLNTLTLSGWNPVPHARRLQGNYNSTILLHIEIEY